MKQKLLRREAVLEAVQEPAPAQVIGQVLGGDAPEAAQPSLEVGVVAIDALDVPDTIPALAVETGDERTGRHFQFLGDGTVGRIAIGTQHSSRAQHRTKSVSQGHGSARRENLVELNLRAALHSNDHRGLFATFAVLGLSATLLRGAGNALALAFVGNREEGFVRFHDACQRLRLLR